MSAVLQLVVSATAIYWFVKWRPWSFHWPDLHVNSGIEIERQLLKWGNNVQDRPGICKLFSDRIIKGSQFWIGGRIWGFAWSLTIGSVTIDRKWRISSLNNSAIMQKYKHINGKQQRAIWSWQQAVCPHCAMLFRELQIQPHPSMTLVGMSAINRNSRKSIA